MRGKGTLQPCSPSSLLLSFSSHSSPSHTKSECLLFLKQQLEQWWWGLKWIMNVSHKRMSVAYVFRQARLRVTIKAQRNRNIVIANIGWCS